MSLHSLLNPTEGTHSKLQVTPSRTFLLPETVGPQHTPSETPQYCGAQIALDNIDFDSASKQADEKRKRNADSTKRHRRIKELEALAAELEAQVAQLQMENHFLTERCHVLERSLNPIRGNINPLLR